MSCCTEKSVSNHYDGDWPPQNAQINRQMRRISECGKCTVCIQLSDYQIDGAYIHIKVLKKAQVLIVSA